MNCFIPTAFDFHRSAIKRHHRSWPGSPAPCRWPRVFGPFRI